MKVISLLFTLLLYQHVSFSQAGSSTLLTWMKGDNTIEQPGIYGTCGVADAINKPGARDFSATWNDNDGNMWLFGGYGFDANNNIGYLNDLWKFDPVANKWTWVKGDKTTEQYGQYGQQGIAQAANKPGSLYASVSWTDAEGNFWLFGGFGYTSSGFGFLNDLWKYDPVSNQWTWVKGSNDVDQPGVYGSKGVAHYNNKPGARYGSRTWTDNNGNLWLFGGYGYDNSTVGYLNDLWKYSPSTNKWTWIKGDNCINATGVYGQKGIANSTNKPGARYIGMSWKDASDNLWLLGGYGLGADGDGQLNDLWKYNIASNEWTWVKGDNTINKPGIYGSPGIADSANKPGARYLSVSWTDENNAMWLFGGYGLGKSAEGYLNDLWKYDPAANKWTWVKGDSTINQYAVYGTQGMLTVTTKSGARTSSVSWMDGDGNPWFFGGYGFNANTSGMLNDLWKISSIQVLPLKLSFFTGALKNGVCLLQWQTEQEINFSHFVVERSTDGVHFTDAGTLSARGGLQKTGYDFADDVRDLNTEKIFYRLRMTDIDGSFTYSRTIRLDKKQTAAEVSIYPNPAASFINVSFQQNKSGTIGISIVDMKGIVVKKLAENVREGRISLTIDISSLPASAYVLSIMHASGRLEQKFIKQ